MLDWTYQSGWRADTAHNHADKIGEIIVVLRDPVERWISGIAQYVSSYIFSVYGPNGPIFPGDPITEFDYPMSSQQFIEQYNDLTERLFFDVIDRFDDHVWPQCELIASVLPTVSRKYFMLDRDFETKISGHLGIEKLQALDKNPGSRNRDTAKIQEFFRERLQKRPELEHRLRQHYAADYELITQVT